MIGKSTFAVVFLCILFVSLGGMALAADELSELPVWYRLLEPLGVVIGSIALWISYKNFRNFGGVTGKSYKYLMGMLVLFVLAFILRSLTENGLVTENLLTDAIFELLLYTGVALVAFASHVTIKGFKEFQK